LVPVQGNSGRGRRDRRADRLAAQTARAEGQGAEKPVVQLGPISRCGQFLDAGPLEILRMRAEQGADVLQRRSEQGAALRTLFQTAGQFTHGPDTISGCPGPWKSLSARETAGL